MATFTYEVTFFKVYFNYQLGTWWSECYFWFFMIRETNLNQFSQLKSSQSYLTKKKNPWKFYLVKHLKSIAG